MLKQLKDAAKCVLIMPVFGLIAVTAIYLAGLLVSSPYIAIMYIFREYDCYLYDPVVWSNTNDVYLKLASIDNNECSETKEGEQ